MIVFPVITSRFARRKTGLPGGFNWISNVKFFKSNEAHLTQYVSHSRNMLEIPCHWAAWLLCLSNFDHFLSFVVLSNDVLSKFILTYFFHLGCTSVSCRHNRYIKFFQVTQFQSDFLKT